MTAALLSALLQLLLVLVIALVAWLAMRRPEHSFARFVGLTPSPATATIGGIAIGAVVVAGLLLIPGMAEMAGRSGTSAHQAGAAGSLGALLAIAVFRGVIQTALSEEIFFRGLIGRNLIRRIGFARGNAIQAVLFGSVHGLIGLLPGIGWAIALFAVLLAGAFGWINGWLNERLGGGSILPGWTAHATANFATIVAVGMSIGAD